VTVSAIGAGTGTIGLRAGCASIGARQIVISPGRATVRPGL